MEDGTSVVVLGAGPAGAAAVLSNLSAGQRVLWITRQQARRFPFGEHLSPDAGPALAALGASGIFDGGPHVKSPGVVSYWGEAEPYERDYIFNPFGAGWNLDREAFDQALAALAVERGAGVIEVLHGPEVSRAAESWCVRVSTPKGLRDIPAAFLIDATGRNAYLARRLGSRPKRQDRLVALFGMVDAPAKTSTTTDTRLMIEPMPDGWWYSLTMLDGQTVAVFLTDIDLLPVPGKRSAIEYWTKRLEESNHTGARTVQTETPAAFAVAPAHGQYLPRAGGDGWMAVGDACMACDPLSGDGIARALQDGLLAANIARECIAGRQDLLATYIKNKQNAFARYLEQRGSYYADEPHWPNQPFWMRRRRDSQLS